MSDGDVTVAFTQRDGGTVATLTVDRPAKLNVLNGAMCRRFVAAVGDIAARDDVRVVVLRGAGERATIGGADITEMAGLDSDGARAFITGLHETCQVLRDLPVPVVARLRGYCLGGGLEIAAACDLRVAATDARFAMPEVRVGIPSVIEAALLPALIGWGRTRRLLYTGETIDAATAYDWGFVEKLVADDPLDAAVAETVDAILAAGPNAIRAQKALIAEWERVPLDAAIAAGIDSFAAAFETDEPNRAMRAFIDRKRG